MQLSEDNLIVHGLWIGNRLSLVELLTLHSFTQNGHIFWLWAYDTIINELPEGVVLKDATEIIPKENVFSYRNSNQFGHGKGSYAGFSDIFRYRLLFLYGGWWSDMDITCLKPLRFSEKYFFRTHHELPMVGNLMKCPKESELMKYCYEKAVSEVDENNNDWHKPIEILNEGVKKFKLQKHIHEITNPDSWRFARKLMTGMISIPEKWYAIHWVNEEWRRNGVNKDYYLDYSFLGRLMIKYKLNKSHLSRTERFRERLRLSFTVSAIKQLPSIMRYLFSKRKKIL